MTTLVSARTAVLDALWEGFTYLVMNGGREKTMKVRIMGHLPHPRVLTSGRTLPRNGGPGSGRGAHLYWAFPMVARVHRLVGSTDGGVWSRHGRRRRLRRRPAELVVHRKGRWDGRPSIDS
jgi:hypothetical protein